MGYRGPAPKPSALVLLEGNPGKRPINKLERNRDALHPSARRTWMRIRSRNGAGSYSYFAG